MPYARPGRPGYQIELAAEERDTSFRGPFPSKYVSRCGKCDKRLTVGEEIYWSRSFGAFCATCYDRSAHPPTTAQEEAPSMPFESLPPDDYTGPILAGQRWRQRGLSGHPQNLITVLRVGSQSVMLVIEGGGSNKGSHHKAGERFNIPFDVFRRNHILHSQPPGVKAADLEALAAAQAAAEPTPEPEPEEEEPTREPIIVTVDTATNQVVPTPEPGEERPPTYLDRYFESKRRARDFVENLMGQDLHDALTSIAPPPIPPILEPMLTEPTLPTPPSTPQEEPVAVATVNTPAPEPVPTPPTPTPPTPTAAPTEVAPERDPLDAFLDSGRAVVERLSTDLLLKQAAREEVAQKLAALDDEIAGLVRRRDKAEQAVEAAIAAVLGEAVTVDQWATQSVTVPTPPPTPEPVKPVTHPAPRSAPHNLSRPGDQSQTAWVLDRLGKAGAMHVGSVADAFGAEFGLSREASIKNVSSILGSQMRRPVPQWPQIVRVGKGTYRVPDAPH